ncbi:MAG: helix-turn-helix domain-containing protein [Candidatus Omnitrophica bacterium]|nr:helix-turn-helix domain-containing protein [Candidatus Omnitrophota bacterium]
MEMYLDKQELAKVLKIPVTSIDYYRREKGMPHIKIGKHHRYILAEVLAWVKKWRNN